MIPVLYEHSEKEFETQGLGSLTDALSCTVTEELNSTYELQMTYPIDGIHFEDIINGRIILAEPAPKKEAEPFSIYKITKPIDGIVTVYAEHISYMLNLIPVKPFSANNCTAALQGLIDNSIEENPFTVWTDKNVNSKFNLTIPQAFRKCLGGVDGSILDTYRGEFEFNRFTVKLHTNRGSLKESAKIIYGKNLTDLTQEESISNVVTGIIPYWKGTVDDVDTTVMLPESKIDSEFAKQYAYNRTVPYDFSSEFQEEPTEEQLRSVAESYVKNNLSGKPEVSITVSFVSLADSEENKGFASELLYLGDSVPVYFYKLGIESTGEIVSATYNVLSGRYESITIGSVKSSLSKAIQDLQKIANGSLDKNYLDNVIEFQKKLISGGYGGYKVERFVNGHPTETVWGDTDDVNTMKDCVRINKNGIGFSKSGYNGPYSVAITIAGEIDAGAITFGELNGNLIKARTIYAGALDDGLTSTIESAQSSADLAKESADSANSSALNAQERANNAYDEAIKAQQNADSANKLADNAWQGIDGLRQIVSIDDEGVKVKESANSSNYSHVKSDGMHVIVDNQEVAKFGRESHIDNLAVSEFMMFGAHRSEFLRKFGEDGTAFYWVGDVE